MFRASPANAVYCWRREGYIIPALAGAKKKKIKNLEAEQEIPERYILLHEERTENKLR